jgi:hypothetical protein
MSFVDCYLPCFRQQLITCPLSAFLSFQSLFTEGSHWDQLLAHPLLQCTYSTLPFLLCVPFQFLIIQFFFFEVCPGGYADLSQEWLWEYCMMLICSPVGLPDVSQAGLELVPGSALLLSQCKVAWRSFVWAGGSCCWCFDSSWCFISAKCGFSISAKFWFMELILSASALQLPYWILVKGMISKTYYIFITNLKLIYFTLPFK